MQLSIAGNPSTVIRDATEAQGWLNPSTSMPSDSEIAQLFLNQSQCIKHSLDTYLEDIKQWGEEGINDVVIQRSFNRSICTFAPATPLQL